MEISIDVGRMTRDIRKNQAAFRAMRGTVDHVGYGAVMTSHRKGTEAQRDKRRRQIRELRQQTGQTRVAHLANRIMTGWGIASFLRKKGHDPFEYPPDDVEFAAESIQEEVNDALEDAYRTGRPQMGRIRRVLEASAAHLRDASKEQIETGKLGKNAERYRYRKHRAVVAGFLPNDYGEWPPYGVRSGQFVKGIRKTFFARKKPPIMR